MLPETFHRRAIKRKPTEPAIGNGHVGAFGEILPYYENKIYIDDKQKKDKWGLNVIAIDFAG